MAVVTDPEAVSFIADRGGRLYVYADASGLEHVKTEAPDDPSIRLEHPGGRATDRAAAR
ncbi:MAG TPA: hypothetical protein VKO84_08070 [Gaiellaceae bacterium]|nr:hypothetical protein [Gaiellaceae bacterium]